MEFFISHNKRVLVYFLIKILTKIPFDSTGLNNWIQKLQWDSYLIQDL